MDHVCSKRGVLIFTLAYIVLGGAYILYSGNAEFFRYLLVLTAATLFFSYFHDRLPLTAGPLWLLSIVGLLHLLGGTVPVENGVLYEYVPFPTDNVFDLTVIKFDQIVHFFASAVGAIIVFAFLKGASGISRITLAAATFLSATGLGALNEVIELYAKLTVPNEGVGGYYNNALDLVFNALGAASGTVVAMWRRM